jgi:acetaldehyde dehydrogenase (acetylating)
MSASTIEGTDALMKHERTALILATGGTGLVKAAYSAGKPAFGVGPGNVPAYIESTADAARAVKDILTGKTFDNGTLCSSEQSIVCDASIKDQVLAELKKQGAHICSSAEKVQLEKIIQTPRRTLNTKIVGQSARKIAELAGFSVDAGTRAIVAMAEGVGPAYPVSMEKLSPILAFYTVKDWREGCEKCIEILSFGGLGHTLSLHTKEDQIVREFGLRKPAFRICVNTPAALGAVGYTTNLFPAMTLGCGAQGNNITSDNISPLHLINLKRVAYGVRDAEKIAAAIPAPVLQPDGVSIRSEPPGTRRGVIEQVVDGWLGKKAQPKTSVHVPVSEVRPLVPASGPRLSSYSELTPSEKPAPPPQKAGGVPFVCEEDVRTAILANDHSVVGRRTIVTPAARDLGEAHNIFLAEA